MNLGVRSVKLESRERVRANARLEPWCRLWDESFVDVIRPISSFSLHHIAEVNTARFILLPSWHILSDHCAQRCLSDTASCHGPINAHDQKLCIFRRQVLGPTHQTCWVRVGLGLRSHRPGSASMPRTGRSQPPAALDSEVQSRAAAERASPPGCEFDSTWPVLAARASAEGIQPDTSSSLVSLR